MWSGFSSEIETHTCPTRSGTLLQCRMWSGFSSEIETVLTLQIARNATDVACGAASRLRVGINSFIECDNN